MDASTTTVPHDSAARAALIMALTGIAFLIYAAAGWLGGAPDLPAAVSVYDASPADGAASTPAGSEAIAVLAAGFALLLIASALLLRSRQHPLQSDLRDPRTGLYTALYAAEALPGLVARDDRAGQSRLVLVLVRVDAIDDVRRRYGGRAVDLVLVSTGRLIRSQTREDDLPVEPDGEDFAVYLYCEEPDQAGAFCRRLATLLSSEQLDWDGDVIKVSVSTRIVVREIGESIEVLQQRAHSGFAPAETAPAEAIEA